MSETKKPEFTIGDRFLTKTGRIRIEEVKGDNLTYSIWPTDSRNPQKQRRMTIDSIDNFKRRYPERKS